MSHGIEVAGLTVRYPGSGAAALDDVSLTADPGCLIGVTGRTGSGKSTLALAIAGFLPDVVRATVTGRVLLDGSEMIGSTAAERLERVGIVFSSPSNQLSRSKRTVREELAFGLENLGVPPPAMDQRIERTAERLGIGHLLGRDPGTLSGGEEQRVAIASIVVMAPPILVLDEPTAELDPIGARAVAAQLDRLRADGTTILCATHDPTLLDRSARTIRLDAGRVSSGTPPEPSIEPLEWTGGDGRDGASVALDRVSFGYPGGTAVLRDVSLEIEPGEAVAIVGANGSGKTTLAKHLIGILRPVSGGVLVDGTPTAARSIRELARTVGFAFQDPADQLFERTVEREVAFGPGHLGHAPDAVASLATAALAMTGLTAERRTNPYDLDRSIRKLVTLAGVLAMDPRILVLDEPTTGQDRHGVERVGRIVEAMRRIGRTVIAVTHDPEFAERWFDRIVELDGGCVASDRHVR